MTLTQVLIWNDTIPRLITAKIMTREQIAPLLKSFHPDESDDNIMALVNLITKEQK